MSAPRLKILNRLALLAGLSLWTLAPYGGCSCENPLATSNPGGGSGSSHGALVDDFEDGATSTSPLGFWKNVFVDGVLYPKYFNGYLPQYRVNLWGGGSLSSVDTFGASTYNSKLATPGDNSVGAFEYYGTFGRNGTPAACTCGAIYPYDAHRIYLSNQGIAGDADVLHCVTYAAQATGLQFNFKPISNNLLAPPATSQPLNVLLILLSLETYASENPCAADANAFHEYQVSGYTSGIWAPAPVQIPFTALKLPSWASGPGVNPVKGVGANSGSLANPAAYTGGSLRVMAIEFEPWQPTGTGSCPAITFNPTPFDFVIDNLGFY